MATINRMTLDLLGRIVDATNDQNRGYTHSSAKSIAMLEEKGYIMVDRDGQNAPKNEKGEPAVRATDEGVAFYNRQNSDDKTQEKGAKKMTNTNAVVANNVEMPKGGRGRRGARSAYPIDDLEVGQAIFVPQSEDVEEPFKKLNALVTNARRRHSVPSETETYVDKHGEEKPRLVKVRDFQVREIQDGGAIGFGDEYDGVQGAAVWRTA